MGREVNGISEFVRYPLVRDLAPVCFGISEVPRGTSIEQLFQRAIDAGDTTPVEKLIDELMKADYYLTQTTDHLISEFVDAFPSSSFASFNYDGLLEITLLKKGRWRPDDGFGLPVSASLRSTYPPAPTRSTQFVYHLHGSLYLYSKDFETTAPDSSGTRWIRPRPQPQFVFDPDSLAHRFLPFGPAPQDLQYTYPRGRIIAPVPAKAREYDSAFVKSAFVATNAAIATSDLVVVIGFSFNPIDEAIFSTLLQNIYRNNKKLLLIDPNAGEIAHRLRHDYLVDCEAWAEDLRAWRDKCFAIC